MRQTVADLMQVHNPEDGQTLIPSFSLSFCIILKLLISKRLFPVILIQRGKEVNIH